MKLVFKVYIDGWDLSSTGEPGEGMVEHAIEVCLSYRLKDHIYTPDLAGTAREQVIKLSIGELHHNIFLAWDFTPPVSGGKTLDCILVKDPDLVKKLFYQSHWLDAIRFESESDLLDEAEYGGVVLKYDFTYKDECTFIPTARGKDSVDIMVANFHIVRICNVYQFADSSVPPYYKIIARHLLSRECEGTFYLAADDENRLPDVSGYKYIDVEVLFQLHTLRIFSDIAALFCKFSPRLLVSSLNIDHLQHILQNLPMPRPETAIMRFGRQPNGYFVGGNVCFKGGELYSHDQAGVAIMPQYFSDQAMSILPRDYPKFVHIPFCQVRYVIAVDFWNTVMPKFFLNNCVQAQAALAFGVMGLHASKFWEGQSGLGHGMPVGWLHSSGPNTGKTEAARAVQSLIDLFHVSLLGGDATKAALFDKLALVADMPVIVDDFVVDKTNPTSKFLATLFRSVYDKMTRTTFGKTRTAQSTAIFTSNGIPNEDDAASQSRCLQIDFDPLDAVDSDPGLYATWQSGLQLLSACAPDFESMLYNGKLDSAAIQDCAQFVQLVIGRKRDRQANLCAPRLTL